jgi:hypothetical protein
MNPQMALGGPEAYIGYGANMGGGDICIGGGPIGGPDICIGGI